MVCGSRCRFAPGGGPWASRCGGEGIAFALSVTMPIHLAQTKAVAASRDSSARIACGTRMLLAEVLAWPSAPSFAALSMAVKALPSLSFLRPTSAALVWAGIHTIVSSAGSSASRHAKMRDQTLAKGRSGLVAHWRPRRYAWTFAKQSGLNTVPGMVCLAAM